MTMIAPHGNALRFDRAGTSLIAAEPDGIAVVELATHTTTRIAIADARSAAGFGDELWIATREDRLLRVDRGGRELAPSIALPFAARGVLTPVPCGGPGALWDTVAIAPDGAAELPPADAMIAITTRRHVAVRGARLVLPTGVTVGLPANAPCSGGAVMTDGKTAIVVVGRLLLTVALGLGKLTNRIAWTGVDLRIATRRGIAVVLEGPRTLRVLDVLLGRDRGCAIAPREVLDIAIDPAGERVAIRDARGIEIVGIAELLARRGAASVVVDDVLDDEGERGAARCHDTDGHRACDNADPGHHALPLAASTSPASISTPSSALSPSSTSTSSPTSGSTSLPPPPPTLCPTSTSSAIATSSASTPIVASAAVTSAFATDIDRAAAATDHADAPLLDVPPLLALAPLPAPPAAIDPALAQRELLAELRGVELATLEAIATAWDTRRIAYGNEGRHPFEHEVAALLGLTQGFAPDQLAAARALATAYTGARAEHSETRGPGTPIHTLAAELELSPRAIDILLVVASSALRGELARLFTILANDTSRAGVDEHLVTAILASRHDRDDLAAELDPRAPLLRLGLLRVDPRRARPFATLDVDPAILDRLRGVAPDLGAAVTRCAPGGPLAALDIPRTTLAAACAGLALAPHGPARIAVRGRSGTGRRTLLAALARAAHRDLAVIDATALPAEPAAFEADLARALRRVQLAGLIPCIANLGELTFGERAARDVARETLRAHPGPLAVTGGLDDVALPAGHLAIDLPALPELERRDIWRRVLATAGHDAALADTLAARYRIGPGAIRRAVATIAPGACVLAAVDGYLRQTRDARLGRYARRVTRLASWANVVLPPDILDSVRELIARVRHRRTVFDAWGMSSIMTSSRGLTALFQGPPGTGKTLVAGVIARELGLDLYQVDLSKVMSKWIGETEANLSKIFDAAEDGQVVLLFDEADSLFARRTEVKSSNDRYANLEVNYLLQRIDQFEGIAILTTNSGTAIDQAFKRRMSFRLSFPFPDEETRELLWRAHLPAELPVAGPLTLGALARKYQLAGGYIRNACLRAAFLAAQDETPLHQRHLERAVALEFAELGKLSSGGALE
jgi:hypothetical protein